MNSEVRDLSPAEADTRLREGTLTIVDVRPPQERELAARQNRAAGWPDWQNERPDIVGKAATVGV